MLAPRSAKAVGLHLSLGKLLGIRILPGISKAFQGSFLRSITEAILVLWYLRYSATFPYACATLNVWSESRHRNVKHQRKTYVEAPNLEDLEDHSTF
ncbi:hypothetical protein Tco_0317365 [Tanacetum coccineum]